MNLLDHNLAHVEIARRLHAAEDHRRVLWLRRRSSPRARLHRWSRR